MLIVKKRYAWCGRAAPNTFATRRIASMPARISMGSVVNQIASDRIVAAIAVTAENRLPP